MKSIKENIKDNLTVGKLRTGNQKSVLIIIAIIIGAMATGFILYALRYVFLVIIIGLMVFLVLKKKGEKK